MNLFLGAILAFFILSVNEKQHSLTRANHPVVYVSVPNTVSPVEGNKDKELLAVNTKCYSVPVEKPSHS